MTTLPRSSPSSQEEGDDGVGDGDVEVEVDDDEDDGVDVGVDLYDVGDDDVVPLPSKDTAPFSLLVTNKEGHFVISKYTLSVMVQSGNEELSSASKGGSKPNPRPRPRKGHLRRPEIVPAPSGKSRSRLAGSEEGSRLSKCSSFLVA